MQPKLKFCVLHPTDFSEAGRIAFAHAVMIAVTFGSELTILRAKSSHPEKNSGSPYPPVRETLENWQLLKKGSRRSSVFERLGIGVKKIDLEELNPLAAVAYYMENHAVDLVVLSTHFQDGYRRRRDVNFFRRILNHTDAQILVVPDMTEGFVARNTGSVTLNHILVPVAHEPRPDSAINDAAALSYALGEKDVNISLIHVGEAGGIPSVKLPSYSGCLWRQTLRCGQVADEITTAAEELPADLIVMTIRDPKKHPCPGDDDVTAQVLQKAPCPVLIVTSPD